MKRLTRISQLIAVSLFLSTAIFAQNTFTHTVKLGETVYSIAKVYNITIQDIYNLNPNAQSGIRIGEALRIPQKGQPAGHHYHTIAKGETLYSLTNKYQISAEALTSANPGLTADNFRAGQVIIIPDSKQTATVSNVKNATTANPQKPKYREMYTAKRKETIFGIARKFGLTTEELIAANPKMKAVDYKLKKGEVIAIPYPTSEQPQNTSSSQQPATETINKVLSENKGPEKYTSLSVGVILPFKKGNNESAKMIEFYQGILLAIDKIRQEGISVEVYTYDSGTTAASMKQVLNQEEGLSSTDVIFGPLYASQIPVLSEYCQKRRIKMVVPFTGQFDAVFKNPYIYAANAPKSYQYGETYELVKSRFASYNIIILDAMENNQNDKQFTDGLRNALKTQGQTTKSLSLYADEIAIAKAMSTTRKNLLVPTSASIKTLNILFPKLKSFTEAYPQYEISMLGFPEWQTYTDTQLDYFYQFDTYIFSPFYRNPFAQKTNTFEKEFAQWFKKPLINSFPRFGMMGYDLGYFFLKGLSQYGFSFDQKINKVKTIPLQHDFTFTRCSNWGGFINNKIELIHYTPNKNIEIIEFKNER